MRVYVVGPVTIEAGAAVVPERDLPGNQGRLVLAMLAVEHRTPVGRDRIADELWPDGLPRSWETALRAVISKVRKPLTRAGLRPDVIEGGLGCYRFRLDGGFLDLDAAAAALHTAETKLAGRDATGAVVEALIACAICRRPFLPGLYNPWTVRQRDRIRELHVEARQCLAEGHAAAGRYALSARAAEGALDLDPYREALHQRLIRSRALAGDRMGAARVFARYRELMRTELGIEPTPETVAVFRESVSA